MYHHTGMDMGRNHCGDRILIVGAFPLDPDALSMKSACCQAKTAGMVGHWCEVIRTVKGWEVRICDLAWVSGEVFR